MSWGGGERVCLGGCGVFLIYHCFLGFLIPSPVLLFLWFSSFFLVHARVGGMVPEKSVHFLDSVL